MKKTKAFVSFDYDHDLDIKNSLVGQSKLEDSPFDITDISIMEAVDENWKAFARKRIRQCEVVIFICGKYTDRATGVAAEMSITREERKPYFLLCGRKDGGVKKPKGALATDIIYRWEWENLKLLISGKR
ncbi:MAG: hypothetical protein AB7S83_04865 [Candidatus Methanomethylophilaceae archaeon]